MGNEVEKKLDHTIDYNIPFKHLHSLDHMCKRLHEIENSDGYYQTHCVEHTALAHSSVILSACLLESTINVFFCDKNKRRDIDKNKCRDIDKTKDDLIIKMWKLEIPKTAKYSILNKYEIALALLNRSGFKKGELIYQNASLLIKLRNELVHSDDTIVKYSNGKYEDKNKDKKIKDLEGKFNARKGAEKSIEPFFPYRCFGHGCAEWSAKSAVNFIKEFYKLAGLASNLTDLQNYIKKRELKLFT